MMALNVDRKGVGSFLINFAEQLAIKAGCIGVG